MDTNRELLESIYSQTLHIHDHLRDLTGRLEHIEHRQVDLNQAMELQMAAIDDVKAAFASYAAKVDSYILAQDEFRATVDQLVADAIAADDANEDVDLAAFAAAIQAAADKVPSAPVPPPPAPSTA